MVDPKTLAMMRAAAGRYLLAAVEVLAPTAARDSYGRETVSYAVVATHRGQLSDPSGAERAILERLVADAAERVHTARLALPHGVAVDPAHHIRVDGGPAWTTVVPVDDATLGAQSIVLLARRG